MAKKSDKSPILNDIRRATVDEAAAVAFLEDQRWNGSAACPICGSVDVYAMKSRDGQRHKHFRWRCRDCAKMFSVRTGTVLEETRLPLRVWVHAFWRACSSKKGVSALQISRECEITPKSALFLMHRIREAMRDDTPPLLGGDVEVDETFVGGKPRHKSDRKTGASTWRNRKSPVLAMVERGGNARARVIERVDGQTLRPAVAEVVREGTRILTDEHKGYSGIEDGIIDGSHETVNHSAYEYVRGDVTTNTVEGFFSLIKRGVYGTFHSVSKHHLHRYVDEFVFRYNHRGIDDADRVSAALAGAEGKRLVYRQASEAA